MKHFNLSSALAGTCRMGLLLLFMLLASWNPVRAQSGTSMYDAFVIPINTCATTSFTDNQGSTGFSDHYGNPSPDIWYTFTLSGPADVGISLCGSNYDTYLYVLDQYGELVASNDDNGPFCSEVNSSIYQSFEAGTYYIVVEGYTDLAGTQFSLDASGNGTPPPGANMGNAINAGTFNLSGNYSDSRSNADGCLRNSIGQPSNDLYYKFTLSGNSNVTLSHCGSDMDTYMHLLDASGTEIASNDDSDISPCPGNSAYIEATLAAGTYYVVSEGVGIGIGNIVTTIGVVRNAPAPDISYAGPLSLLLSLPGYLAPVNTGGATYTNNEIVPFAGSGTYGSVNGLGALASFSSPEGLVVNNFGIVYVADRSNNQIRKITPDGLVTTFAGSTTYGSANGTGTMASFHTPRGLAIDVAGNLYVADYSNHLIRKITPSGVVTTVAGSGTSGSSNGTGTSASFNLPGSVAVDASGNLYVADEGNHMVRKITSAGVVTTLAGSGVAGNVNGTGTAARLNSPHGIGVDNSGNVYVGMAGAGVIKKITPLGVVTTYASGFVGDLCIDGSGNIYVADYSDRKIKKIAVDGTVTVIAGSGAEGSANGPALSATFKSPGGVAVDAFGNLYISDRNNLVRKMDNQVGYTISPQLPQGLSISGGTGVISGTPEVLSPLTVYTVTAYNRSGSSTATLSIEVKRGTGNASPDQNHIFTYTPRVAITDVNALPVSLVPEVNKNIQYFDGLGRPLQTVEVQASASHKDVIQPYSYDQFGREAIKYLPYTNSSGFSGSYRSDAIMAVPDYGYQKHYAGAQRNFYEVQSGQDYALIGFPCSETRFERSQLNTVSEQGSPGTVWQTSFINDPVPVRNAEQGRSVITEHLYNNDLTTYTTNGYAVRQWDADTVAVLNEEYKRNLTSQGYYSAGALSLTVIKDENWLPADGKAGTVEEYKDKQDRLILKRIFNRKADNSMEVLSTYYVYDYLGNLSFVIPPGALGDDAGENTSLLTVEGALNNYCYQYRYDERNRLVEKKLPGKEWEYMVYNKLDQIVATQDAEQRKRNVWINTRYDKFGRTIMTGTWNNGNAAISRTALKTLVYNGQLWDVKNNLLAHGYELKSYPLSLDTVLTVNYYDNYDIKDLPAAYDKHGLYSSMTNGMLTGSKTLVLNGGSDMLWEVNYYDDLGRSVKQISQHYKGGILATGNYDETDNVYAFDNKLLTSTRSHKAGGTEQVKIKTRYDYDDVDRIINTWQQINNADSILLAHNEYNELGQLKTKQLHSANGGTALVANLTLGSSDKVESGQQKSVTASNSITLTDGFEAKAGSVFKASIAEQSFLQTIRYAYNERGWLKQINDPDAVTSAEAFGMKLFYNDHTDPSKQQFNGNISGINWQSKVPAGLGFTQERQGYDYSYDKLNRIKLADYVTAGKAGHFNEALNYDIMGNITGLERKASGTVIDQLSYHYDHDNLSNRLMGITDNSGNNAGQISGATAYTYDDNGSLLTDDRKALRIQYNLANLPKVITKTTTNETITYIYDAAGRKLRKLITGGNRDYIDGIEYDNSGDIEFIQTAEGRAVKVGDTYSYEYMLKDHLGNTRSVVKQDGSILQVRIITRLGWS